MADPERQAVQWLLNAAEETRVRRATVDRRSAQAFFLKEREAAFVDAAVAITAGEHLSLPESEFTWVEETPEAMAAQAERLRVVAFMRKWRPAYILDNKAARMLADAIEACEHLTPSPPVSRETDREHQNGP